MRRLLSLCLSLVLALSLLSGCGKEVPEGTPYQVSYLNREKTKVVTNPYYVTATDTMGIIAQLIEALQTQPEEYEMIAPMAGVNLLSYEFADGLLLMDFDSGYRSMTNTEEVLTRAAIVRSLDALEEVSGVSFTIAGEALLDALGNPVGVMKAENFVDNPGTEINSYEQAQLHLYFANSDGTALVDTYRTIAYSTNISMERLVIEQLIAGPNIDEVIATIPADTKIISIAVNDGVCYVNLDDHFLAAVPSVSAEVTIYSIVNSLVELTSVNKVSISVNGASDMMYRESISLAKPFERNLELIAE
ncbi:MAG: GerMN domain-containing protein [Lachnospiraceae bacterium]|nr:GerMN domain-containing protein [Lachnospiraceae bacterium]